MAGAMDERVVALEFDNKSFEKNVRTSMKTLDDLKESLDFDDSSESLENLESTFKKFSKQNAFEEMDNSAVSLKKNMGKLGDSASNLFKQFAEVTKITAMFELAENAVKSLERTIKQFTIAPISQGFDKYTTKIGAIKTISNATGMGADAVNSSLERLNWFTDETSASFDQMVQNIGKFTSVGRGLEESITAMEGIATWGYHSGADVGEINRAMYNLSQALGTGSVKLIDWKSIENAGMATKEFKEQAIKAAEAAGTLKRKGDKLFAGNQEVTVENFNSTLQKGWFSSQVLMDTLTEYGSFADTLKKYQEQHPGLLASEAMRQMDKERKEEQTKLLGDLEGLVNKTADTNKEASSLSKEIGGKVYKITYEKTQNWDQNVQQLSKDSGEAIKTIKAELQQIYDLEDAGDAKKAEKAWKSFAKKYGDSTVKYFKRGEKYTEDPTAILAKSTKMSAEEIKKNVDEINAITDTKKRAAKIQEFSKTTGIEAKKLTEILDNLAKTEESLGEKAMKSSQQSKSLKDSIDATMDAVSTQWMNTFQTIFGGLDESIALWSNVTEILWNLFASGGEGRNNALKHWAETFGGRADLFGTMNEDGEMVGGVLNNIADTIITIKEALGQSIKDVFFGDLASRLSAYQASLDSAVHGMVGDATVDELLFFREGDYWGRKIKEVTKGMEQFTAKIKEFLTNENNLAKISKIFTGIAAAARVVVGVIEGVVSGVNNFISKTGIFQDILNLVADIGDKIRYYSLWIYNSQFFQKLFGKIGNAFGYVYNTLKKWIGQVSQFFEDTGIGQMIRDWWNGLLEFFLGNGKEESQFFKSFGWLYTIKDWIDKINLYDILTTLKYFADNFGIIWQAFSSALTGQAFEGVEIKDEGLGSQLLSVIDTVRGFGEKLSGAYAFVKDIYDKVVGWLESSGILPKIREWWNVLTGVFENFGLIWDKFINGNVIDSSTLNAAQTSILDTVGKFLAKITTWWDKLKGWYNTASTWLTEKWNLLIGWLDSSGILPTIRDWRDTLVAFFDSIGLMWDVFVNGNAYDPDDLGEKQASIMKIAGEFVRKLKVLWGKLKDWWNKATTWLSETWGKIVDWLETTGILPKVRSIWKTVTDFFSNIGLLWDIFVTKNGKYNPDDLTKDQLSIVQKIENFINNIKEKFEWIKQKFTEIKDKVAGWLEETGILPTLRGWWSSITGWFESLEVPGGEDGPLASVKEFFEGLYGTVLSWFGGGEEPQTGPKDGGMTGGKAGSIIEQYMNDPGSLLGDAGSALQQGVQQGAQIVKKAGPWQKMWENIKNAFVNTDTGALDIGKGLGEGVIGFVNWIAETLGGINWKSAWDAISSFFVDGINSLNESLGQVKYDNIKKVFWDIINAFTGAMWAHTLTTFFSTVSDLVTRGQKKTALERFAELLKAIGNMLLQIGVSVLLIAASMWIISKIDPARFNAAKDILIGIGAVFLALVIFAAFANNIGKNSANLPTTFKAMGAMFVQIGAAIVLIVAAIWLISNMVGANGEIGAKMQTALIVVGSIMIAMVGLIAFLGALIKSTGKVEIAAGIAAFFGMAILLVAITACIMILSTIDYRVARENAITLGGVLLAIAVSLAIIGKMNISGKALAATIILGLILAGIAAAFVLLKDADGETILNIAEAFAIVLVSLIGLMAVLDTISPAGAIKGALAISAVLAILSAVVLGITIVVMDTAEKLAKKLIPIMSALDSASTSASTINFDAITNALELMPKIVDGFKGVMSVDTSIAMQVAKDTKLFLNELNLASSSANNVKIEAFKAIFGEDGTGGIIHVIQTGLSQITNNGREARLLGWNLERLGNSLQLMGTAGLQLSTIQDDGRTYEQGIQAVKEQLGAVQEIVGLASSLTVIDKDGKLQEVNLDTLAGGITKIGEALKLYNIAVGEVWRSTKTDGTEGEIKAESVTVENLRDALQQVFSVMNQVPPPDGEEVKGISAWAVMAQDDNGATSEFALGLSAISSAMIAFSNASEQFDDAKSGKAIAALQMLADIYTQVKDPSLYTSTFEGVKEWQVAEGESNSDFANELVGLSTGLITFGNNAKNVSFPDVWKGIFSLGMFTLLYNALKANEKQIEYVIGLGFLGELKTKITEKVTGATATFNDFGTGIGLLGQALETFNNHVAGADKQYDVDKVKQATEVLKSLSEIQTALRKSKLEANWWTIGITDENIGTFGSNISGLGSILSTFSKELVGTEDNPGFALDVATHEWESISTVLTFLAGIAVTLGGIEPLGLKMDYAEVAYDIEDLSEGIKKLAPALQTWSKAMNGIDLNNGQTANKLGEWTNEQWNSVKEMLDVFKQMTLDFHNAGLKENEFYDLADFAHDITVMFSYLNNQVNPSDLSMGRDDVSSLARFINRITAGSDAINMETFSAFTNNLKTMAEASGVLHSTGADAVDVSNICKLLEGIMKIDMTGFTGEVFNLDGMTMATEFLAGFLQTLSGMAVSTEQTDTSLAGSMTNLISAIDEYQTDFYDIGLNAGQQYAEGFNAGLEGINGTPETPTKKTDTRTDTKLRSKLTNLLLNARAQMRARRGQTDDSSTKRTDTSHRTTRSNTTDSPEMIRARFREQAKAEAEKYFPNSSSLARTFAESWLDAMVQKIQINGDEDSFERYLENYLKQRGFEKTEDGWKWVSKISQPEKSQWEEIQEQAQEEALKLYPEDDAVTHAYASAWARAMQQSLNATNTKTFEQLLEEELATSGLGKRTPRTKTVWEQALAEADKLFPNDKELADAYAEAWEAAYLTNGSANGAFSKLLSDELEKRGLVNKIAAYSKPTGSKTPVVEIGADGKTGNGGSVSVADILSGMNVALASNMSSIMTHLEGINGKLPQSNEAAYGNGAVVQAVSTASNRLADIQKELTDLKNDVSNLKVYLNTGALVGEIAPYVDRALGTRGRRSYVATGSGVGG